MFGYGIATTARSFALVLFFVGVKARHPRVPGGCGCEREGLVERSGMEQRILLLRRHSSRIVRENRLQLNTKCKYNERERGREERARMMRSRPIERRTYGGERRGEKGLENRAGPFRARACLASSHAPLHCRSRRACTPHRISISLFCTDFARPRSGCAKKNADFACKRRIFHFKEHCQWARLVVIGREMFVAEIIQSPSQKLKICEELGVCEAKMRGN